MTPDVLSGLIDGVIREHYVALLRRAAEAASGGAPDNEPGDYYAGRRAARDAVLALIEGVP